MDKVAVLIACHNRKAKTLQCLSALPDQIGSGIDFRIDVYLVDDNSTDGTAAAVKQQFPEVNIIPGNGHLYWSRGMHLAWEKASAADYDYYLWLNDDTFIRDLCVAELIACSKRTSDNAIICASICSAITKDWTYGGYKVTGTKSTALRPTGEMIPCETFNGNCVLVPHLAFKTIGNIDPRFIHAIGDLDYGLRATKLKIDLFIAPHYLGYCEKNPSLPKWCLPAYGLRERVANLYSPLGSSHPLYFFRYENRHFGLFAAIKHFFTIHLRLVIPQLWKQ